MQDKARSKLFISYSRVDLAFANELVTALEQSADFQILIDRIGIGHGEAWRERLGRLIVECDTLLFVLSPDSVASEVCAWEIGEARRLSKRIIPVPWRAVEQPIMMPKPELVPLTGGNRRIPAMQVGADVYCDTACIARRIEQLHPERPVIPQAAAGTVAMIEDWADHRLFMFAVPPTILALFDDLPPGFIEDRRAMSPGFSPFRTRATM